jgi:hypothetical protein
MTVSGPSITHNAPHEGLPASLKRMRMSRRSVQKDEEAGQYEVSSEGSPHRFPSHVPVIMAPPPDARMTHAGNVAWPLLIQAENPEATLSEGVLPEYLRVIGAKDLPPVKGHVAAAVRAPPSFVEMHT